MLVLYEGHWMRRMENVAIALDEIAGLLAVAYQRYRKIERLAVDSATDSVNRELAIPTEQSVHGVDQ